MSKAEFDLTRKLVAEGLGTALLVAIVIGSGIMAETLASGNAAVALLGNTLATGAGLMVLILVLGPVSGAHFNPVVSLFFALQGKLLWWECGLRSLVQVMGGLLGTFLAHAMFDLPFIEEATHARTGAGIWIGEAVATFGLILTIASCAKNRPDAVPYAVGLFIIAGYWFTSSTSFANPAVTIARCISNTFTGIRPEDVVGFIAAQITGALMASVFVKWMFKKQRSSAA